MTGIEPTSFVSAFVGATIYFFSAYFIHSQKFTKPYLTMFALLQGLSFLTHGIYGMAYETLTIINALPLVTAAYYSFFFLAIMFLVKFISFPLEDFVSITQIKAFRVKMLKLRPSSFIIIYALVMAFAVFLPGAILAETHLMESWYMIGAIGFLAGYFQTIFWIFWFYWHYKETILNAPVQVIDKGEIVIFIMGILSLPVSMILHPYAELSLPDWAIHTSIIAITIVLSGVTISFETRRTPLDRFFSAFSSKEQIDLLKTAIQQSFEGMAIVDMTERIVFVNSRWAEIHGYKKNELIGKDLSSVYNIEQMKKLKDTEELMLKKGSWTGEITHSRKDGSIFPTLTTKSLLRDSRGQPIATLTISTDITEQKRMQKELQKYSQQLEKTVKTRTRQLKETEEQLVKSERLATIGELAAMVGHDLRNPLTGIAGATYYLKTKLSPKMDKKAKEMFEIIEKDIKYSDKIINDLLEYSREMHLEQTETSPKSIIEEALSMIEIPKNIRVSDLTTNKPKINVDIEKLRRVFINIIKNAVEAMPKEGKLTIKNEEANGNLMIVFKDTGKGMPKDVLEKIGTPLFTTKSKGMGFGLSICKRIIEAHGGNISTESTMGKGTTFIVTIPLRPKLKDEKIWVNLPKHLLTPRASHPRESKLLQSQ